MDIINSLKDFDTQLFLFFNGKHNSFFDTIMLWASHKLVWIPLYAFLFYLVYKHFGKKVWLFAIAVMTVVNVSAQDAKMKLFIAGLMKKMTIDEKIGRLNLFPVSLINMIWKKLYLALMKTLENYISNVIFFKKKGSNMLL